MSDSTQRTNEECTVSLVAIGPGSWDHLTQLAVERLSEDVPIFCRMAEQWHPVVHRLKEQGKLTSLFHLYEVAELSHKKKYELFADIVIEAAQAHGRAIYAVPGNLFVFEMTPSIIVERCKALGIKVERVPGLSSTEAICADVGVDPARGLSILDAAIFDERTELWPYVDQLLFQVFEDGVESLKTTLLRYYPAEHVITVVANSGFFDDKPATTRKVEIGKLETVLGNEAMEAEQWVYELVTVYVPQLGRTREQHVETMHEGKLFQRARHVAECVMEDGNIALVTVQNFTEGTVEDHLTILDTPKFIRLWQAVAEPKSMEALLETLGSDVEGEEDLKFMLRRMAEAGLVTAERPS